MRLIDNHSRVRLKIRFLQKLSQQHTVSHVLYFCLRACVIIKSDCIAHLLTQFDLHLLTHPFCHAHCSYPSGLGASYLALQCVTILVEVLGQLGGLA